MELEEQRIKIINFHTLTKYLQRIVTHIQSTHSVYIVINNYTNLYIHNDVT